jgi:hypothetical protein
MGMKFIYQINNENIEAEVLVEENIVVKLEKLLSYRF